MKERREYFRFTTFARVALRRLSAAEHDAARRRVRSRHVPDAIGSGAADDTSASMERRLEVDLLRRMAFTLERIERRLEQATSATQAGEDALMTHEPVEISLSGSGFSVPVELDVEPGALIEVELDLLESGLPAIPAIARALPRDPGNPGSRGLRFEELHPTDEERLVRQALETQSETLRVERVEEAR